MSQPEQDKHWLFNYAKWHGYVFSLMFVLYGGVMIILGVLDRQLEDLDKFVIFLLLGIALEVVCLAYRDRKTWGWYGLLAVNGLVVILSLIGIRETFNIVILVFSAASIGALLAPQTKGLVFDVR